MKDQTFSGEDPVSIIAFSQDSKAACDAYNIHARAAMGLFKHYLSGLMKAVIKARVALPTDTSKAQEGFLTSYSAIINYLLELYVTDDNITTADAGGSITRCHWKTWHRGRNRLPAFEEINCVLITCRTSKKPRTAESREGIGNAKLVTDES